MEISKDSWHYKLNKSMSRKFEGNVLSGHMYTTCTYIRTTALSILSSIFFIFVMLFLSGFVLTVLSGMIVMPLALSMGLKGIPEVVMILGVAGWLMAILTTIGHIGSATGKWISRKNEEREEKAGLINQALKDRKDGICTIVTFK